MRFFEEVCRLENSGSVDAREWAAVLADPSLASDRDVATLIDAALRTGYATGTRDANTLRQYEPPRLR